MTSRRNGQSSSGRNDDDRKLVKRDSKILQPMHMFRSWRARKTKHPQDHLGRPVTLEKNVTPPFGRVGNVDSHGRQLGNNVHYVNEQLYKALRDSAWNKPTKCQLCPPNAPPEEFRTYYALCQHIMTEHCYMHCNATEFVCTDKMFQINTDDRDYDELSSVQHGFFMSCEESFNSLTDIYFHYIDIHCLEDHCDICGKWLASRRGCLIDHVNLCHIAKNRELVQCPASGCPDARNMKFFQDTLRHVIDRHCKIVHLCQQCMGGGGDDARSGRKTAEPSSDVMQWTGVFKSREAWLEHVQKQHPGVLVADVITRATRLTKPAPFADKLPPIDCVICYKRGQKQSWDNRTYTAIRCKTLQGAIDHIFEEHIGEAYICWNCQKIQKYTNVKHTRECLLALTELYEMRNIRTDKKLWYAWPVKRKSNTTH